MLLALGILLLLLEVIKGARPGAKYLTDHLLSLIVFGAAAAEFVLWPQFGTSTFFLLTMLALVDFLSGIALRTRRGRRTAVARPRGGTRRRPRRLPPSLSRARHRAGDRAAAAAEPAVVAGSRRADRSIAEVAPSGSLAAGASPGLQPGDAHPRRQPRKL